jgi:hypothetical protein
MRHDQLGRRRVPLMALLTYNATITVIAFVLGRYVWGF